MNPVFSPRKRGRPFKNGKPLWERPPLPPKIPIKVLLSHTWAFHLLLDTKGLKVKSAGKLSPGRTVCNHLVKVPIRKPAITYELLGKVLIRTVDSFHYISKHTEVNGLCRSFSAIQRKFLRLMPLHGAEEIEGIHDVVWRAFRHRYFVGRLKMIEILESDLSIPLRYVKLRINGDPYFIVQLKSEIEEGFTEWRMFKALTYPKKFSILNPSVPLTMTQEEIIEDIKNGKITKITEYGNPKRKYSPEEVLFLLNQSN